MQQNVIVESDEDSFITVIALIFPSCPPQELTCEDVVCVQVFKRKE